MADTDQQDPKIDLDDEAKQLQLDEFKAKARQAIADADAKRAATGLYTPKSEPVKGETTLGDDSGSLLAVVALRGLDSAAKRIADAIKDHVGTGVLIVEDRALALSDAPHKEITERLSVFEESFKTAQQNLALSAAQAQAAVVKPQVAPVLAAGAAGMSAIGLAADLVGMFKTDYSVAGRKVNVQYAALAAAVAGKLPSTTTAVIDGLLDLRDADARDSQRADEDARCA